MEFAKLDTLSLYLFNKNNDEDIIFIKNICGDTSIKEWFQGITIGLLINKNYEFFNHGFIVKENDKYIGYIGISNFNIEESSVYLRAAILKEKRGLGYGKILLSEITDYIFRNYSQIKSIRFKIAKENTTSLYMANSCDYKWLKNDIYIKYNPYIIKK